MPDIVGWQSRGASQAGLSLNKGPFRGVTLSRGLNSGAWQVQFPLFLYRLSNFCVSQDAKIKLVIALFTCQIHVYQEINT